MGGVTPTPERKETGGSWDIVRQSGPNSKLPICGRTCLRRIRWRVTEEDISGICTHPQAYPLAHPHELTTYTPHRQHTEPKLSTVWGSKTIDLRRLPLFSVAESNNECWVGIQQQTWAWQSVGRQLFTHGPTNTHIAYILFASHLQVYYFTRKSVNHGLHISPWVSKCHVTKLSCYQVLYEKKLLIQLYKQKLLIYPFLFQNQLPSLPSLEKKKDKENLIWQWKGKLIWYVDKREITKNWKGGKNHLILVFFKNWIKVVVYLIQLTYY